MKKNLSYIVIDDNKKTNNDPIIYENLLKKVMETDTDIIENINDPSMQTFIILTYEYQEYKKKELEMIADYYNISKRKKRKDELIQDVIIFELDPNNIDITQRRKTLWFYIEEIKTDNYLRKYLILD